MATSHHPSRKDKETTLHAQKAPVEGILQTTSWPEMLLSSPRCTSIYSL